MSGEWREVPFTEAVLVNPAPWYGLPFRRYGRCERWFEKCLLGGRTRV